MLPAMTYLGDGESDAAMAPSGAVLTLGATTVRVLADMELTGGRYSMYSIDLAANGGMATPHFHRNFSESFQVLAGRVELYDGMSWTAAGPGSHLFIPPGSIHGYRNTSPEPVSLIMLTCPGAPREDYFAELADVAANRRQLSPEEWTELLARHDQYSVPDATR